MEFSRNLCVGKVQSERKISASSRIELCCRASYNGSPSEIDFKLLQQQIAQSLEKKKKLKQRRKKEEKLDDETCID